MLITYESHKIVPCKKCQGFGYIQTTLITTIIPVTCPSCEGRAYKTTFDKVYRSKNGRVVKVEKLMR